MTSPFDEPLTIVCPVCSSPPVGGLLFITPWFCPNDACMCLAWDPYASLEDNLTDAAPLQESRVVYMDGDDSPTL